MLFPSLKEGRQISTIQLQTGSTFELYWKLKEKIGFKKLFNFLLDNNLLYKYQSSFLPRHSTVHKLLIFFIIYAKFLIIICFLVLFSVVFQSHLTESGIKVFC